MYAKNVYASNAITTNILYLLVHCIFLYHVAIDLKIENLVLEIWFLITQLDKSTLDRAEHCQSFFLTVLRFSIHTPAVAVRKEPHT